jgi:DNA-binding response OmpR family regulator
MEKIMGSSSRSQKEPSTILVVEDDDELRDLLLTQLELEGYNVFTAHNGAVALTKVQTQKPDVILMDVLMPEMSGIEATRMLKEDENTRHIPVIMVTSEDTKEDMIKGLEAGAIDYITKPFFLPELKARVKAVLRFKSIYDDLLTMREEVIKKEMASTIRKSLDTVNETIDDNLEFIMNKLVDVCQYHKHLSGKDLNTIKNATTNIKSVAKNLNFLNTLVFRVYERLSIIGEKFTAIRRDL